MSAPKIPIFIIVHDRVEVLKKSVQSFESMISTPIEIIFHDVASTFPGCLKYLQEMKGKGYPVYKTGYNSHHTVLYTINKYLTAHPKCRHYIVTDPDIELDNVKSDILEFYIFLIEKYGENLVVGPMLRIDDIPDYYPKKRAVKARHNQQFWCKKPKSVDWKGEEYHVQHTRIDTTFQLAHRNNRRPFPRHGIRCYAPYSARHLDWYIDPNNMSEDQKYYSIHASTTAHWGKGISPTIPEQAPKKIPEQAPKKKIPEQAPKKKIPKQVSKKESGVPIEPSLRINLSTRSHLRAGRVGRGGAGRGRGGGRIGTGRGRVGAGRGEKL